MCLALALAGALDAAAARAGTYQVAICHDPANGSTAPTDGISFPTVGSYADAGSYEECGPSGYLYATLDGAASHGASALAAWEFQAPPSTTIADVQLWRAFYAGQSATAKTPTDAIDAFSSSGSVEALATCSRPAGCSVAGSDPSSELTDPNLLQWSGFTDTTVLEGTASCVGGGSCAPGGGAFCPELLGDTCIASNHLYALVVTLEDDAPPVATDVSGTLIDPGVLAGVVGISVSATDVGSGLYSATIDVDGTPLPTARFGSNAGRCVGNPAGGNGVPAGVLRFDWTVPCPLAAGIALQLDTRTLRDGPHSVVVTMNDAADNTTTVWSGTINTLNAPQGGIPQIFGDAQEGQSLIAGTGSWSPTPSAYSYQWERCDSAGSGCTAIAGATAAAYTVTTADAGHQLLVSVTASDAEGSTTELSPRSSIVGAVTGASAPPTSGGAPATPSTPAIPTPAQTPSSHAANGIGACAHARLRATVAGSSSVTISLGRSVSLRGALDCDGAPVSDATVALEIAPSTGAAAPRHAEIRTAADGSFVYVLGPGASRQITLSYREFAGAAAPSATASARVLVTPSITLRIAPTHTSNGHTITFSGSVSGGEEPRGGLPLDLEYLEGTRWMIYDVVRAAPGDGHFTYRYTFERTTQSITYTFRVAIPPGGVAGYPYQPTASPPRSVHVDP